MAAGTQTINYGSLGGWAEKLNKHNTDMRDTLNQIQRKINATAGEYESNEAAAIREKITGMTPKFQSYQDVVENYAKFLKNTYEQMKTTSTSLTNNAGRFV